jgi:hypothetical protein
MTHPSPREALAERGDSVQSQAFLATHRGQAAFAREYARLIAAIMADATMIGKMDPERVPVIRQSPERVIVQLGQVAMTVAWLRKGGESAAIGELLFIYWKGTIAPRGGDPTEYNARRKVVVPPTILWEETLVAFALTETAWTWRTAKGDVEGVTSPTLAERCVRRLTALQDDETAVPVESLSLVTDPI